jgi:hypothetical protein
MKIIKATLVSSWFYWRRFGFLEFAGTSWAMLCAITAAVFMKSQRATPEQRAFRKSKCDACWLRNPKYDSCGTPGDMIRGEWEALGCWCSLPLARFVLHKRCWRHHIGEDQWDDTQEKAVTEN